MPTLNWMGKEKVVNHHRDVPYRVLERMPEKGVLDSRGSDCGNTIIHGDNLEALKALLPEYEGKIDCVYIDPPYNTGNEGWVYNDNVNDPRIKRWLGQVVGKEGEDFSRHDKWLCMMYPRLRLIYQLLKPLGAIFVSIDGNEIDDLKFVLDEIFGSTNFVEQITVLCNPKGRSQDKYFATCHEYVVVYSKGIRSAGSFSVDKDEDAIGSDYRLHDERGWYRLLELRNTHREFSKENRPNLYYPIYLSDDGESASLEPDSEHNNVAFPNWPDGYEGCWTWGKEKAAAQIADLAGKIQATGWKVYRKDYAKVDGMVAKKKLFSIWNNPEFYTEKGQAQFGELFPGTSKNDFPQPKSVRLVQETIRSACPVDGIVLDCFAGSGTTAQAVLDLNREDGGRRRFILCELSDYADSITAERARRVIAGYRCTRPHRTRLYEKKMTAAALREASKYYAEAMQVKESADSSIYTNIEGPKLENSSLVVDGVVAKSEMMPGIDSGFAYYELGPELFQKDGTVSPEVTLGDLKRYVWATECRAPYVDRTEEHPYLMGENAQAVYYLAYEPGVETVLTYDLLRGLPRKGSPTIIYADRCAIAPGRLETMGIEYKQIPLQIARM